MPKLREPAGETAMPSSSIAVLMATAMIISTAAVAQAPSNSPPTAPPQAAAEDPNEIEIMAKRLCKAEPIIGTRIPRKRKCNTPAELAAYQRQAREIIESYRRRPCIAGVDGGEGQPMAC